MLQNEQVVLACSLIIFENFFLFSSISAEYMCSLGLLYKLLILHFILFSCLIKVVFDLRDNERRVLRYEYCGFVHSIIHNM